MTLAETIAKLRAEWQANNAAIASIDQQMRPGIEREKFLTEQTALTYPHRIDVDRFGRRVVLVTGYSPATELRIEARAALGELRFEAAELRTERKRLKALDKYYREAVQAAEAKVEAAGKRQARKRDDNLVLNLRGGR